MLNIQIKAVYLLNDNHKTIKDMKSKLIEKWNKGLEAVKINQKPITANKHLSDVAKSLNNIADIFNKSADALKSMHLSNDKYPVEQIVGRGRPEPVKVVLVKHLDEMLETIESLGCKNNHLKNALQDRERHIVRQDSDNFKLKQDLTLANMIISGNDFHELKEENIAMTERIDRLDAKLKKRNQSLKYYRDLVNKANKALNEANKDVYSLREELDKQKRINTIHNTPVGIKIEGNTVTIERNWIENFTVENDMTGCHVVDTVTYKMKEYGKPFCDK